MNQFDQQEMGLKWWDHMLHFCAVCGRGGSALETGSGSLAERTLDRVPLGHVPLEPMGQYLLEPGVKHLIFYMYLWIFLQGHVDSVIYIYIYIYNIYIIYIYI